MAIIAALLTDLFEDSEYLEPVKRFESEGHKVINLGPEKGQTVKGKKKGTRVVLDKSIQYGTVEDFDALLIPGGYSPDKLRADPETVEFVKKFFLSGKPVFAICHGPQLLISADVLKGFRLTGYCSISQDIKNAGGRFEDVPVTVDRNLVCSRHPGDLPQFIETSLEMLRVTSVQQSKNEQLKEKIV